MMLLVLLIMRLSTDAASDATVHATELNHPDAAATGICPTHGRASTARSWLICRNRLDHKCDLNNFV